MKLVLPQQAISPSRAIRGVSTSIGVKKDRLSCITSPALPAQLKLVDSRFNDRQWIAAAASAWVNVN
jgi:hypothetical protein